MAVRRWTAAETNKELSRCIAAKHGIEPFAAHLLQSRGIVSEADIELTLHPERAPLTDPMLLPDMDKAVERIRKAISGGESIMVYGDYDVDGITATSLMYTCLRGLGADVGYMLPSRDAEGYGLSPASVERMKQRGVGLIVTVDNGISAYDEIACAEEYGIDVVVTDHHKAPELLPEAVALVDPQLTTAVCPYRSYAGVGVAFMLACALEEDVSGAIEKYGDLVALGTVADVVPLDGENRTLLAGGLEVLRRADRIGLRILMLTAGIEYSRVTSTDISFKLAPRINSAGRMGRPDKVVELMCSGDAVRCREIANELEDDNNRRHELERQTDVNAWEILCSQPEHMNDRVLVVCGENWHHGVVGIVAQHLCSATGRPCIVLSSDGENARGSGRCFGDFSLHKALTSCSELFLTYGGHKSAAGMTLRSCDIDELRRRLNEYASQFREMPIPEIRYDCRLPLSMLTMDLVDAARCIEPFGECNPSPVIMLERVRVGGIRSVGKGNHQRLTLTDGRNSVTAMYFNIKATHMPCTVGDEVDCLLAVGENEYNGVVSLNLIVTDLRLSCLDSEKAITGEQLYAKFARGEVLNLEEAEALTPSREDFAGLYRWLRPMGFRGGLESLYARVAPRGITYERMRTALDVFEECGLISVVRHMSGYEIYTRRENGKADLPSSSVMKKLAEAARKCRED